MESYIVITADHLTRSANLRLAQMDQRKKKGEPDDLTIRNRLGELKTMAAIAPKTVLVHLSCSDAQLLAPVALPPEKPKVTHVGDININVREGTHDIKDIVRAVRRNTRRLRS